VRVNRISNASFAPVHTEHFSVFVAKFRHLDRFAFNTLVWGRFSQHCRPSMRPDAVAFSDKRLTDDEAEKLARLIVRLPELIKLEARAEQGQEPAAIATTKSAGNPWRSC
jgi:hypothetical protein